MIPDPKTETTEGAGMRFCGGARIGDRAVGCGAKLVYENTSNGVEFWRCPACGNPHWRKADVLPALSRPQATPDPRIAEIREQHGPTEEHKKELLPGMRCTICDLLDSLSALQQRVEHLQAAILPDWRTCGLSTEQIATLAEAHRQDTEVLDRCDEDDPRVLLRKAEQRVEQVTAELAQSRAETEAADACTEKKIREMEIVWQRMLQEKAAKEAAEATIARLRALSAKWRGSLRPDRGRFADDLDAALASLHSSSVRTAETEEP